MHQRGQQYPYPCRLTFTFIKVVNSTVIARLPQDPPASLLFPMGTPGRNGRAPDDVFRSQHCVSSQKAVGDLKGRQEGLMARQHGMRPAVCKGSHPIRLSLGFPMALTVCRGGPIQA